MKNYYRVLMFVLLLGLPYQRVNAQGTAFTYQGRLNSSGVAANGNYDFSFSLYAAASGGSAQAGPINLTVGVTNGLFSVTLDFGALPAATRFLDISVRTNGGSTFTNLVPRQQLTPTPYSVLSENSMVAGSVAAANITGTILNSSLPSNPNFTGTVTATGFSGNGATLTNIPESALNTQGTLGLATNSITYSSNNTAYIGSTSDYYVYYPGPNPGFMTLVTNVNGRGHVDVLLQDYSSNAVVVATNDGGGIFSSNASYAIGGTPAWIAVLDVNNDGKPDWVAANVSSSNLVVFTNSASGFASNTSLTVGPAPACVVAVDINNDSKLDLVAANSGSNTITIYTNNTHGGFGSNVSYTVGLAPLCIAAADVNGDLKKDLIIANSGTNTLSILFANGNGTFLPATTVVACATNVSPRYVVAADFNMDGYNDLATVNNDGTFSILTNNGDGTFTLASTSSFGVAIKSITVADMDSDGLPDLVFGCDHNTIAIFHNNGNGTFSSSTSFFPSSTYSSAYFNSVAVADLNGDGTKDLIAYSEEELNYYLYDYNALIDILGGGPVPTTTLTLSGESGGLRLSPGPSSYPNIVGGAPGNQVDPTVSGSDIGGGGTSNFVGQVSYNHISADFSDIGGGSGNWIQAGSDHSGIFSGWNNLIGPMAYESVIAGGQNNTNNASYGFIGGGKNNLAVGAGATVAGGEYNSATGSDLYYGEYFSTVGGGYKNVASGPVSVVAGGGGYYGDDGNKATAYYSAIVGGYNNKASGNDSFVGGGYNNTADSSAALVSGGNANYASGTYSTVSGGSGNQTSNSFATVPGGYNNIASGQSSLAAGNVARAAHDGTFVWADSQNNTPFSSTTNNEFSIRALNGVHIQSSTGIHLDAENTPMIVRDWDVFGSNAGASKVGIGRWGMFMEPYALVMGIPDTNVIGGGGRYFQVAQYSTNGSYSTLMQVDQNGQLLAVGGARLNDKPLYLRGGGDLNHGLAYCGSGVTNFLPGVLPDGPVLWGFGGGALGTYSGNNAVLTWNGNGVQISPNKSTTTPALRVVGIGNATTPALSVSSQNPGLTGLIAQFGNSNSYVAAITNDGTFYGKAFTASSDRNQKENFTALNAKDVLDKVSAMPLTEWNYKDDPAYKKHIGPMAQDFYAAFALNGADDKHISMIDEGGVALAAIQGLNQKVDDLTTELRRRDAENEQLKARLTALEKLIQQK